MSILIVLLAGAILAGVLWLLHFALDNIHEIYGHINTIYEALDKRD